MKISVVTVSYNTERFISQTIESVLSQDYHNFEYIIVDGKSTDHTPEIIARYDSSSRFSWSSRKDKGISDAMNIGAGRAQGDIISFLHADDCYRDASVLSSVAEIMGNHPGEVWLTGGIREIDEESNKVRDLRVRKFSRRRLLRNNILFHPSTFIHRNLLLSAGGYDTDLRYAMDYDLWLKLSAITSPIELDEILACFRVHSGSRSSANRLAAFDEEYQVRKRYLPSRFARMHSLYYRFRRPLIKGLKFNTE